MSRRRTTANPCRAGGRSLLVVAAVAAAGAWTPAIAEEIRGDRGGAAEFHPHAAEEFESRTAATDPLGRRSPAADAAHAAGARAREFGAAVGEAGTEIGHAAGEAGRTVGHTVRDAAVVTWYHVREGGKAVGRTVRDGSRALARGIKGEPAR